MREILVLLVHLISTVVRLARPGGLRAVVAESVLVRHQLLILNRGRKRAPNLHNVRNVVTVGRFSGDYHLAGFGLLLRANEEQFQRSKIANVGWCYARRKNNVPRQYAEE